MISLQTHINNYLNHCQHQKQLDAKTLKAYRIDLAQFSDFVSAEDITNVTSDILEDYICGLHQKYKPKTVNLRILALNKYLEIINKGGLKLKLIKIQNKTLPSSSNVLL